MLVSCHGTAAARLPSKNCLNSEYVSPLLTVEFTVHTSFESVPVHETEIPVPASTLLTTLLFLKKLKSVVILSATFASVQGTIVESTAWLK